MDMIAHQVNPENLDKYHFSAEKTHNNAINLSLLATLQSSNLIVSEHPFRMEIKNITPEDVTLVSNLDIPVMDKKVKIILIELLQNVIKNQQQEYASKSYFVLEQKDDVIHIEISNYLQNIIKGQNKVDEIKTRIDAVNLMDLEEIKALYKHVLDKKGFTETGGGGLGFIDMAKRIKTLNPGIEKVFDYQFAPTEEDTISQFVLKLDIPLKNKEKGVSS